MSDHTLNPNQPFFGKDQCCHEYALSKLLEDDVLFANEFEFFYPDKKSGGTTTILFINCNDLFYWGCADAENLPYDEIPKLYKMHMANPNGSLIWCCFKRNLQPQEPIVKRWKELGIWTPELEALPKPAKS